MTLKHGLRMIRIERMMCHRDRKQAMANRRSQIAGIPRGPQAEPCRRPPCSIIPVFHRSMPRSPAGSEKPTVQNKANCRAAARAKQSQSGRPRRPRLRIGDFGLGIRGNGRAVPEPEMSNKANLAGPAGREPGASVRNKANLRRAKRGLTTAWKEDYDEKHGSWRCENKANLARASVVCLGAASVLARRKMSCGDARPTKKRLPA